MALVSGVVSRYVKQGYVAEGYVEGQPIEGSLTITSSTPSLIKSSGSVVSSTTAVVTIGGERIQPDFVNYTWDQCGSGKFDWDNWFIGNTWEKRGFIIRGTASVSAVGAPKKIGVIDVFSLSDVSSSSSIIKNGITSSNFFSTTELSPGVIRDFAGAISSTASISTLGGLALEGTATINVTSVTSQAGVNIIRGLATVNNLVEVDASGVITVRPSITVPVETVITSEGFKLVDGLAEINLGAVVVTVGSSTPIADPFRTASVQSETRGFVVNQETRTGVIQSESRIIIIPKETRTFTVQSETRTFKVPVPPFVSGSITERENV